MMLRSFAVGLSAVFLLSACAYSGLTIGHNVSYGDAKAVEGVTNEFGSTDLQMIAQAMTASLLQSPVIGSSRPVLTLADVKNKTSEYIDTASITEKIRTQMLKSGMVRFGVGINDMQSQVNELQRQNQSGLYASKGASKIGNMQAAQYRLEGSISSIVKRGDGMKDVFYLFTLNLISNETGLIEWSDEKEIRKTSGR
jgi:penicillin-binding protein activator